MNVALHELAQRNVDLQTLQTQLESVKVCFVYAVCVCVVCCVLCVRGWVGVSCVG